MSSRTPRPGPSQAASRRARCYGLGAKWSYTMRKCSVYESLRRISAWSRAAPSGTQTGNPSTSESQRPSACRLPTRRWCCGRIVEQCFCHSITIRKYRPPSTCADLYFNTIETVEGVMDFSTPGLRKYKRTGVALWAPGMAEDDTMDVYTARIPQRQMHLIWDVGSARSEPRSISSPEWSALPARYMPSSQMRSPTNTCCAISNCTS